MELLFSIRRIVSSIVLAIIGSKEKNHRMLDTLVLVTSILNLFVSVMGLRNIHKNRVS